ncbi:MAG: hypothetical protein D4R41_00940 [Sediminibacterium sp.]|nr:MAG: hypothetical protein D4R41_00940 [Sediminibacterium sp.]
MRIKILFFVILFCLSFATSQSQIIYEDARSMIYPYLTRLADKGLIELQDVVLPITHQQINVCLQELQLKRNLLSKIELAELDFYKREYQLPVQPSDTVMQGLKILEKDHAQRLRGATVGNGNFFMQLDPVSGMKVFSSKNQSITQYGNGANIKGFLGKHFNFQFYYRDITESGKGIDYNKTSTDELGIIKKDTSLQTSLNYSDLRATLSFQFKNGSITVGQDQMSFGYANHGRIVLSNKSPSFPLIRLDYRPLSWLHFNYAHLWLQSNIIDSSRIYNLGNTVYGGKYTPFVNKYMVMHSLQIIPKKGMVFSIGESIVYNDQLYLPYFVPVLFFKLVDQNNTMGTNNSASGNSQLFFQFSMRNIVPKTHIYTTLLIDELRITKVFNATKSRNQVGATLGIERQDVLPNLSIGAEYTRVNPFVYENFITAESYKHAGYSIGDWMGNNFDRKTWFFSYKPLPRLLITGRFDNIRKGGPGTLLQQYFSEPQPDFLFDYQWKSVEASVNARYEIIHQVYAMAQYYYKQQRFYANISNPLQTVQQLQLGLNIGW